MYPHMSEWDNVWMYLFTYNKWIDFNVWTLLVLNIPYKYLEKLFV